MAPRILIFSIAMGADYSVELISMAIEKNQNPGLDWQCCLAGSSKRAPRILIFSMAMGADCTFELISIKTCAPQFK